MLVKSGSVFNGIAEDLYFAMIEDWHLAMRLFADRFEEEGNDQMAKMLRTHWKLLNFLDYEGREQDEDFLIDLSDKGISLPHARYEIYVGKGVSIPFVFIPPGVFMQGGDYNSDESPRHPVLISKGFWFAQTQITQAHWQAAMGNNPARYNTDTNNPVDSVSWHDCVAFCKKLDQGRESCANFALPTESQWEYACRAGVSQKLSFGKKDIDEYVWYVKNSNSTTHPVGEKKPNLFGLYDMHGNVWEWCQDWYHSDAYKRRVEEYEKKHGKDNYDEDRSVFEQALYDFKVNGKK